VHISLSSCSIELEALTFNRLAIVQHVIVSCDLALTNTFVTLNTTLLMCSPNPEIKPNITADNAETQTPPPSKKSPSKKKTSSLSISVKEEVLGSPSKDKSKGKSRNIEQDKDRVKEMRRIALETLFEYGVRGETMNNIAAKVSAFLNVGDLQHRNRVWEVHCHRGLTVFLGLVCTERIEQAAGRRSFQDEQVQSGSDGTL
jgi:hypothetical protein